MRLIVQPAVVTVFSLGNAVSGDCLHVVTYDGASDGSDRSGRPPAESGAATLPGPGNV